MKNRLMFMGDFHFEMGYAEIDTVDRVVICNEDNCDELGEGHMIKDGSSCYLCPEIYKKEIKSDFHWYCKDESGCLVLFDKQLRLVCGFDSLVELNKDYPHAKEMKLTDFFFSWEDYNGEVS
jgi:hypothetical protein